MNRLIQGHCHEVFSTPFCVIFLIQCRSLPNCYFKINSIILQVFSLSQRWTVLTRSN